MYTDYFEKPFLEETKQYYEKESADYLQKGSVNNYLKKVLLRILFLNNYLKQLFTDHSMAQTRGGSCESLFTSNNTRETNTRRNSYSKTIREHLRVSKDTIK